MKDTIDSPSSGLTRADAVRMVEELRAEFEEKLRVLTAKLAAAPVAAPGPVSAAAPVAPAKPEVNDDVLLLIAAAVTTYLGKKVRVRSARMLQSPYEIVNPWAQQGRVFVQASHNIDRRGR